MAGRRRRTPLGGAASSAATASDAIRAASAKGRRVRGGRINAKPLTCAGWSARRPHADCAAGGVRGIGCVARSQCPRVTVEGEARVAMVPELVGKLTGLGYEVAVEPGAGCAAPSSGRGVRERGGPERRDGDRRGGPGPVRAAAGSRSRCAAPSAAGRHDDDLVPARRTRSLELVADLRDAGHHVVRDGAGAAHLAGAVDGRADLAGPGGRLPLPRSSRPSCCARFFPLQHDRRRHRPARRGARARRRRRRPPGDRDGQAARRRRPGVRRARRRRRRDPLDGRQVRSTSTSRRSRARAATPGR